MHMAATLTSPSASGQVLGSSFVLADLGFVFPPSERTLSAPLTANVCVVARRPPVGGRSEPESANSILRHRARRGKRPDPNLSATTCESTACPATDRRSPPQPLRALLASSRSSTPRSSANYSPLFLSPNPIPLIFASCYIYMRYFRPVPEIPGSA